MVFKILVNLIVVLLLSCSRQGGDVGVIGQSLGQQTSLYNSYGIATKNVFVVDRTTNRILGLNTETMTLDHEFELINSGEDHYIAVDTNEKFIIDFSKKHLQVIALDGTRHLGTLGFIGTPVSASYNPDARIMVMQDDLYSVGILKFAENGEITDSWLGGPLLAEDKTITAGDIDKTGRLILSASDGSILVVDIAATLAQDAWQFTSFPSGLIGLNWIAPDPSNTDLVLAASDNTLGIINVSTKTLVDSKALTGIPATKSNSLSYKDHMLAKSNLSEDYYDKRRTIGFSKAGKPHVLARSSLITTPLLYYAGADGKIKTHSLQNAPIGYYRQSFITPDSLELVVMLQSDYRKSRVLGVRLTDNLAIIDQAVDSNGSANFNNKILFLDYETGLGRLDLIDLKAGTSKTVQGYNFDYLRTR
jgi:hypothetical protein